MKNANTSAAATSAISAMVVTLTKSAAAPAVKAKTRATRPVNASAKPSATPSTGAINFVVRGDMATRLFAHTAAWLELTGLIRGESAPAELCRKMGGSAYAYHTKKGNFVESHGMATLTAKGIAKFQDRENGVSQGFNQQDKDDYIMMMIAGVNDGHLIKNAAAIQPVEAVKI